MTHELAEVLVECFKLDDVECTIMEDYSGRGMFGRSTTAITGEFTLIDVLSTVIAHAELLVPLDREDLNQDQLGRSGYVVY